MLNDRHAEARGLGHSDVARDHGAENEIGEVLAQLALDVLGKPRSLIKPVPDRPGHDRRYCLDTSKLRSVGWTPQVPFADGLRDTIAWYRANEWWWRPIKEQDPQFKSYYQAQYETRR